MALKHRVVQRFERNQRSVEVIHELVRAALNEWLRDRAQIPAMLNGRLHDIGGGFSASYQHAMTGTGDHALRWKVVTGTAPHVYRSTITVLAAVSSPNPSWLWYDVETDRDFSHFHPPRLTHLLTRRLDTHPRDRISDFTEGLRKVNRDDLGAFLDQVLNAEDRLVPAFVSGSREWTHAAEEHVEQALSPLYGMGTFWKLAPDAFDEFNSLVRPSYAVYPGSIHSFQFGLDTEDEQDSRRHWWFSAAEVAQSSPKDLSRRLHSEAMQSGLHVQLPSALRALNDLFDESEANRLFAQFQVARASGLIGQAIASAAQDTGDELDERTDTANARPIPKPVPRPPRTPMRPAARSERAGTPTASFVEPNGTWDDPLGAAAVDPPSVARNNAKEVESLAHLVEAAAEELDMALPVEAGLSQRFALFLAGVRTRLRQARTSLTNNANIAEIQSRFESLQREKLELQSEVQVLNELLSHADQEAEEQSDILQSQRSIAASERDRADYLASELARIQRMKGAEVRWESAPEKREDEPTSLSAPTSVADLFGQIRKLSHVEFSGDVKTAERITDLKLRGIILRDAWRFACELERYAVAQAQPDGPGSLRAYVDGCTTQITSKEFAADETRTLQENPKYYLPRVLPVPREVHELGEIFMGAHFRLSQDNGKAMRMHIHDATKQNGKVYIGYIGQHLPSRKTS